MAGHPIDNTALQELLDRQAILDCIHRYTRGVDRLDRELGLSAYHPDAIDDHDLFVGSPTEFVDWAFSHHAAHDNSHHHQVTNHTCELDGDTAHTETYWLFSGVSKDGAVTLHGGRYIDRFEKRSGKWGIAARVCVKEWHGSLGALPYPLSSNATMARDKSDVSYQRPLRVEHKSGRVG